jgi:hypothetical protein
MKAGFLVAMLLCLPLVAAAETIRCGNRIIAPGSSSAELASFCGDPTQVNGNTGPAGTSVDDRQVEIWTYNFGPNQLMERVRIINGIVVQIDSLGYGYND